MREGVTVVIPTLCRPSLMTALASIVQQEAFRGVRVVGNVFPTSKARNLGLVGVDTEHVLFMDDDVVAGPRALALAVDRMRAKGLAALSPKIEGGLVSSPTCVFAGAAIFARTEVARELPWDETLRGCEDLDWAWRLMDNGLPWEYFESPTFYHVGPAQTPEVFGPAAQADGFAKLKLKHPDRYAWLKEHDSSVLGLVSTNPPSAHARYTDEAKP